jgi:periplasmic divalent cation tolerance protein
MTNYCIITTTLPTQKSADTIIKVLLQKKLSSCIQIHSIQSHYNWKGKIESSREILLQIKTKISLFEEIKNEIQFKHPYDIPEIIMTPIIDGNDSYLTWIENETKVKHDNL